MAAKGSRQPFGQVERRWWADPKVKRTLGRDKKLLLLFFKTAPGGNMLGLYYVPLVVASDATGIELRSVKQWVAVDLEDWITYDENTEEVLVHGAAALQVGGTELKDGDKRVVAMRRLLSEVNSQMLLAEFLLQNPTWCRILGYPIPTSPMQGATQGAYQGATQGATKTVDGNGDVDGNEETSSLPIGSGDAVVLPPPTVTIRYPRLWTVARKQFWAPDGKPPRGYTAGREVSIWIKLLDRGHTEDDIELAMLGLALQRDRGELGTIKPTAKITSRLLEYEGTKDDVADPVVRFRDYYYRAGNQADMERRMDEVKV